MKSALTAGILIGVSGACLPAFSQTGAKPEIWTYIRPADGTVAWETANLVRYPDGRLSVPVIVWHNTALPVPADAKPTAKSSGPGQTYDFENAFWAIDCANARIEYEGGALMALVSDRPRAVAETAARPAREATSQLDTMIREHVCRSVKPANSGEATSLSAILKIAATHDKLAEQGQ
jgi:hypothetical protein